MVARAGVVGEEAGLAYIDVGAARLHGRQSLPDPAAHRQQSDDQGQCHRLDPPDSVRRAERQRLLHLPGTIATISPQPKISTNESFHPKMTPK